MTSYDDDNNKSPASILQTNSSSTQPLFTLLQPPPKPPHSISYQQAWNTTLQHMHFLTTQIHNLSCAASFDGDTDVEIAVALLSNNSPDFLLSFLACTHISSLSIPLNSKSRFTILLLSPEE
uniref:Uncharacterized protein n=1 Tax=Ditylum brightwellii TaxID=49249 RepID=A0A7S4RYL6_9STRA